MELSRLAPRAGSRKKKKRVGLGEGSGHGKTSSRGGKGQTARKSGHVRGSFEGGQMPLYRRLPKYGFRSASKAAGLNAYTPVNLSVLERFSDGATVDAASLREMGVRRHGRNKAGFKVLATGALSKKLHVKVQAFSKAAKAKIEELGGTIEIVKQQRVLS